MVAVEASSSALRFWLEFQGRTFELRPGEVLIGRSSSCHLVLDDGLVSRRHAQIVVSDERALIEDFGSANGVFVNGERVAGSRPLNAGDQLQVGKQQFVVRAIARPAQARAAERFTAETLHGLRVAPDISNAPAPDLTTKSDLKMPEVELTHREEVLELLGQRVTDKVLALGRGDEAERMLSAALNNILTEVKKGREPAQRVVSRAGSYAWKARRSHGSRKNGSTTRSSSTLRSAGRCRSSSSIRCTRSCVAWMP